MRWLIYLLFWTTCSVVSGAESLRADLEATYNAWRNAVIQQDLRTWKTHTAPHRQMEIRNRIVSEKKPFPAAIFQLPSPPPSLEGLKFLSARQNGRTAKSAYFGKVDFGVGGQPTDNLLVLSFVRGNAAWLYDNADFVNLSALPEVRKELAAGNLTYLKETADAQPDGVVPRTPVAVRPAKYIAKVYVFCPGREVEVQINKFSRHRFANAQEAEVVLGGAVDGPNEIQFRVEPLEGGQGNEAFTVRVYLMSQVSGVQPVKVYEYLVREDGKVKPLVSENFQVDAEDVRKLMGAGK